jgi:hypothetical protein
MRMMIRYQSGLRAEAVLLAANRERMRLAICSQRDTIELHRVDAGWRTERGAAIEIEALMAIPGTDFSRFCAVQSRRGSTGARHKSGVHGVFGVAPGPEGTPLSPVGCPD